MLNAQVTIKILPETARLTGIAEYRRLYVGVRSFTAAVDDLLFLISDEVDESQVDRITVEGRSDEFAALNPPAPANGADDVETRRY